MIPSRSVGRPPHLLPKSAGGSGEFPRTTHKGRRGKTVLLGKQKRQNNLLSIIVYYEHRTGKEYHIMETECMANFPNRKTNKEGTCLKQHIWFKKKKFGSPLQNAEMNVLMSRTTDHAYGIMTKSYILFFVSWGRRMGMGKTSCFVYTLLKANKNCCCCY